ncbi:hypothetical protein PCYB_123990 [Plasmodium cynomolgi strain B]|uniref:Uncharacterized protein n=1 Tax=Plasmodium cynomolgi (strain B) TaxID=1120755 RepID=K6ULL8_PLACD|nr:hypothetical protein PCYB_123990 [Plasmodium cynomolgi strain B]GAB67833.1 hypothetical protein PCYB_123990 [Plasmodium cynomolgi strain B]
MKRRTQGLLLVCLLIFLEASFCLSLFSKSAFPREYRDVQVFRDTYLTPVEEEDLKVAMKKYAGNRFIQEYESLMNDNSKDSKKVLAKSMVNLIKQQFVKLKEIEATYVTPNFDQYKQVMELKPQVLVTETCLHAMQHRSGVQKIGGDE